MKYLYIITVATSCLSALAAPQKAYQFPTQKVLEKRLKNAGYSNFDKVTDLSALFANKSLYAQGINSSLDAAMQQYGVKIQNSLTTSTIQQLKWKIAQALLGPDAQDVFKEIEQLLNIIIKV